MLNMSHIEKHNSNNLYKCTASEKLDSVITTLCAWRNKSCKGSIEQRIIWAVKNESFLKHEVRIMKGGKYKQINGNRQPVQQASTSDNDFLPQDCILTKTQTAWQKKESEYCRKLRWLCTSSANSRQQMMMVGLSRHHFTPYIICCTEMIMQYWVQ